ncbi:MAG: cyclodeaminase/cyclohydrolase family protein, partial [Chloroflexota bacterium]|nr:cyclodeaminase/cyclohydrolase family protein [Chloroflexota bacterium]
MDDRLTNLPTRELIERLATSDPIPGGGSAAALAGAMGAALVHMVVALTTGRADAADHEAALTEIASAAEAAQADLLRLA